MFNELGQCQQVVRKSFKPHTPPEDMICGGTLSVRMGNNAGEAAVVFCEECGARQLDHPISQEAAAQAAHPPQPVCNEGVPQEYASSYPQRILILESTVRAQARELAELKTELAALWARLEAPTELSAVEPRRKRNGG